MFIRRQWTETKWPIPEESPRIKELRFENIWSNWGTPFCVVCGRETWLQVRKKKKKKRFFPILSSSFFCVVFVCCPSPIFLSLRFFLGWFFKCNLLLFIYFLGVKYFSLFSLVRLWTCWGRPISSWPIPKNRIGNSFPTFPSNNQQRNLTEP